MDKQVTLGLLAITETLNRIAGLSIAYQEGRITADDFAETVANVLADAEPRIQPV